MYYYAHWTFATGSLNGSQETLYGLQKSFPHEAMCTLFTRHVLDTPLSRSIFVSNKSSQIFSLIVRIVWKMAGKIEKLRALLFSRFFLCKKAFINVPLFLRSVKLGRHFEARDKVSLLFQMKSDETFHTVFGRFARNALHALPDAR